MMLQAKYKGSPGMQYILTLHQSQDIVILSRVWHFKKF
jgi:hypothetical protein